MIALKQINGGTIDLSVSEKFVAHYNKPDTFAKYILDEEIHKGEWFDEVLHRLPKEAVIIDAGMNVGLFALYMNKPGRKFYGIEPTPIHVSIAQDLFGKLNVNAEIYEGALYSKDGRVNLLVEGSNTTMNRIGVDGWPVNAIKLKSLFEKYGLEKVDLLKIDIEGGEQEVLMNDDTIGPYLQKCQTVFMESHNGMDGAKVDVPGIIAKMQSLGFSYTAGRKIASHYFVQLEQRV